MQKTKNTELFELLLKNDENELKKFILFEGKQPKAICPIQFVKDEVEEENEKE